MTVIKLRRTPKSAFNPDRPASRLLQAHIEHLEHVLGIPPRKQRKKRTEGEAARYIGELTARVMAPPAPPPPPGVVPPAVPPGETPALPANTVARPRLRTRATKPRQSRKRGARSGRQRMTKRRRSR
jgi:hypothetical protein